MNLIEDNNSIKFACFKCLRVNRVFTVISSSSTFDLTEPNYKDKALKTKDTLKRDDGVKKVFMRAELKTRFTNVEQVIIKQ